MDNAISTLWTTAWGLKIFFCLTLKLLNIWQMCFCLARFSDKAGYILSVSSLIIRIYKDCTLSFKFLKKLLFSTQGRKDSPGMCERALSDNISSSNGACRQPCSDAPQKMKIIRQCLGIFLSRLDSMRSDNSNTGISKIFHTLKRR